MITVQECYPWRTNDRRSVVFDDDGTIWIWDAEDNAWLQLTLLPGVLPFDDYVVEGR